MACEYSPEKRIDPDDGEAYTQEDFLEAYGGLDEWNAVSSRRNLQLRVV